MERNQIIGIILIMATFFLWTYTSAPSKEELEKSKRMQDSIALVKQTTEKALENIDKADVSKAIADVTNDSVSAQLNNLKFGAFSPAAVGQQSDEILENEFVKITFNTKGGIIKEAILKKHYKTITDSTGNDTKELVTLLDSEENKFQYNLPVQGSSTNAVNTSLLYFKPEKKGNTISFKAIATNGGYFEQKYELSQNDYTLKYSISTKDLSGVLTSGTKALPLFWENHLGKYEKGEAFEQSYSTVYFKEVDERRDYCSCVSDDAKVLNEKPIEWISHVNQFFN